MADIFISYKREDKHLAEDTIHALKEAGFSVWYDERIDPHTSWDETIEREIAAAKAVVVLWTPRSVASQWVRTEADYAAQHGKIVPVMLEQSAVPLAYRRTQFADLTQWDGNPEDRNFEKLAGWVRGLVDGTGAGPESIGASTFGAEPVRRKKKSSPLPVLALLAVLLIAGAGGLYATGIIGPGVAGERTATTERTPQQIEDTGKGSVSLADLEQAIRQDAPPPNAAPLATNDTARTQSPSRVIVDVLANDRDGDGDTLSVTTVAGKTINPGDTVAVGRAGVKLNPDGTLLVTPDPTYVGSVEFSYTVSDGQETDQAMVSVSVAPPPPPACFTLRVVADDKDRSGANWDFPAPSPDIHVTSDTHRNLRFGCDNSYQCRSGRIDNPQRLGRVTLLIQDEDIDQDDLMGAGNCDIPSRDCRLGGVVVDVAAC